MIPLMEAMFTMDPPLAFMCAIANFDTSAVPMTFTPSTFSQSRVSAASTLFCVKSAALFTTISMPPNACAALSAIRRSSASLETSAATKIAFAPRAVIFLRRACPAGSLMSFSTRRAPSSAKRIAMASPMPAPAPVTMATLSANRMGRSAPLLRNGGGRQIAADHNFVDHAVLYALIGTHDVIAIDVAGDALHRLASEFGEYLVERLAHAQDLFGINIDIRRLSGKAMHGRLVNHDPRIGKAESLALGSRGKQHGRHRGRLSYAERDDIGTHKAHGVENCQPRGDGAARRVDVDGDVWLL